MKNKGANSGIMLPHITCKKTLKRFTDKIQKTDTCWIWNGTRQTKGYGQLWYNGKLHSAHRISYAIYNGGIEPDKVVMHTCDNPNCVNPEHLKLGTQSDNMQDAKKKNRAFNIPPRKGEENNKTKLNEEKVLKIRELYEQGNITQLELSNMYGVTKTAIHFIIKRKNWKHI